MERPTTEKGGWVGSEGGSEGGGVAGRGKRGATGWRRANVKTAREEDKRKDRVEEY
jgi:hypothetical protein